MTLLYDDELGTVLSGKRWAARQNETRKQKNQQKNKNALAKPTAAARGCVSHDGGGGGGGAEDEYTARTSVRDWGHVIVVARVPYARSAEPTRTHARARTKRVQWVNTCDHSPGTMQRRRLRRRWWRYPRAEVVVRPRAYTTIIYYTRPSKSLKPV